MPIKMVDLHRQYVSIKTEIDEAIQSVLTATDFIMGSAVREFEADLATYLGAKHAVGCASGTDALQVAMMALGIGRGDEVITSPFTFVATAETIALLGATPVYVDIDARPTISTFSRLLHASPAGPRRSFPCICTASQQTWTRY